MIQHICDDCAFVSKGIQYNTTKPYGLPKDWIALTINNLQSCVCSWECAERLSRRMAANREHPGVGVDPDRPARIAPPIMVPLAADPGAETTAVKGPKVNGPKSEQMPIARKWLDTG